jgi:DNA-binding response OmpR family regulator
MRVLLIEDDSATAQSMELMLKSDNMSVYTTDLGEEGNDPINHPKRNDWRFENRIIHQ